MLQTLRQPRYVALSAVMVLVATICIGLGTWQISRLASKHRANNELRHNDHGAVAQRGRTCCRSTAHSRLARADDIQFRRRHHDRHVRGIRARARPSAQRRRRCRLPRAHALADAGGTVLVVRGFISRAADTAGVTAPAPPSGTHTIVGRVMPAETASDKAAQLPAGQINSINASEQSSRLGDRSTTDTWRCRRATRYPGAGRDPGARPVESGRRRGRAAAPGLRHPVVLVRRPCVGRADRHGPC